MPNNKKKKKKKSAIKHSTQVVSDSVGTGLNSNAKLFSSSSKAPQKQSIAFTREHLAYLRCCLFYINNDNHAIFQLPPRVFISNAMLQFLILSLKSLNDISEFLAEKESSQTAFNTLLFDIAKINGALYLNKNINVDNIVLSKALTFERVYHVLSSVCRHIEEIERALKDELATYDEEGLCPRKNCSVCQKHQEELSHYNEEERQECINECQADLRDVKQYIRQLTFILGSLTKTVESHSSKTTFQPH